MKNLIYKYCSRLSVIWSLIILGLCATPGQYIPSVSWLELLSFDKWVHATIFFILCSLLFLVVIKKQQPFYLAILYLVLCIIYGGLLELMQATLFSNRSADWQDFVANSFGCVVALLFYPRLKRIFD